MHLVCVCACVCSHTHLNTCDSERETDRQRASISIMTTWPSYSRVLARNPGNFESRGQDRFGLGSCSGPAPRIRARFV